ncbi:MAG TPA: glutamate-5-semialdehyde dehydrogenase [Trueperaceae bacterium]|nr:glutamate-5-semialdehyde dehydrogenase [Trueperaceae bacterium]
MSQTLTLDTLLAAARKASRALAGADRDAGLRAMAAGLERDAERVLAANAEDVRAARAGGMPAPQLDRLTLAPERLRAIAAACEEVAALPDPLGRVQGGWTLAAGPRVTRVTVPFGVIAMVYESRPNVTVDAAALALKAGSAAVLRGSASALRSNRALVASLRRSLAEAGLPHDAVQLVDSPDRELVTELLRANGKVDLVIPRGGAGLIRHVVANATVPVIETGVGNCHVYVDAGADPETARRIVLNAKVQRPGVCNAAETLLVHEAEAPSLLPRLAAELHAAGVELRGCERTRALVPEALPATESDWETEFLDLVLAVRVVPSLDAALEHIDRYGTRHSEAIVTRSLHSAERFRREVDAAAVFVNASTRFNDGFEFGFGAEIGISTQKLHARGPMGLEALVTYKYVVDGSGEVRA